MLVTLIKNLAKWHFHAGSINNCSNFIVFCETWNHKIAVLLEMPSTFLLRWSYKSRQCPLLPSYLQLNWLEPLSSVKRSPVPTLQSQQNCVALVLWDMGKTGLTVRNNVGICDNLERHPSSTCVYYPAIVLLTPSCKQRLINKYLAFYTYANPEVGFANTAIDLLAIMIQDKQFFHSTVLNKELNVMQDIGRWLNTPLVIISDIVILTWRCVECLHFNCGF